MITIERPIDGHHRESLELITNHTKNSKKGVHLISALKKFSRNE